LELNQRIPDFAQQLRVHVHILNIVFKSLKVTEFGHAIVESVQEVFEVLALRQLTFEMLEENQEEFEGGDQSISQK